MDFFFAQRSLNVLCKRVYQFVRLYTLWFKQYDKTWSDQNDLKQVFSWSNPFIKRVKRNLLRSMRKTASQLGISRSSMHKIFKNYLWLTAHKNQSRQLLSAASKHKRHDRSKRMLTEIRPTRRFSQWMKLPTRRIIASMYVMQGICLKVVVPIYSISNPL